MIDQHKQLVLAVSCILYTQLHVLLCTPLARILYHMCAYEVDAACENTENVSDCMSVMYPVTCSLFHSSKKGLKTRVKRVPRGMRGRNKKTTRKEKNSGRRVQFSLFYSSLSFSSSKLRMLSETSYKERVSILRPIYLLFTFYHFLSFH